MLPSEMRRKEIFNCQEEDEKDRKIRQGIEEKEVGNAGKMIQSNREMSGDETGTGGIAGGRETKDTQLANVEKGGRIDGMRRMGTGGDAGQKAKTKLQGGKWAGIKGKKGMRKEDGHLKGALIVVD